MNDIDIDDQTSLCLMLTESASSPKILLRTVVEADVVCICFKIFNLNHCWIFYINVKV